MGNTDSNTSNPISSNEPVYLYGYISNYTINPNGLVNGTINTLDGSDKNSTNNISIPLIENVWGITSPNTNDQLLIMTNDSKYIGGASILLIYTYKLLGSNYVFSISPLYAVLYFILVYKFRSGIIFSQLIGLLSNSKITTLPSTDPNYSAWNQISSSNQNIKNLYMYYAIATDLAKNGAMSTYYNTLNTMTPLKTYVADDWSYLANYYNTLYTQIPNAPGVFCVTGTNKLDDSKEKSDNNTECRLSKNGSSVINTPNGPYGYGGAASALLNNKTTIIWIIVALICCCCCCISIGVLFMMSMKSSGRRRHRGGFIENDSY